MSEENAQIEADLDLAEQLMTLQSDKNDVSTNCRHNLVLDHINGNFVCEECGVVTEIYIDPGAEWTNYEGNKMHLIRCGPIINPLLPKSSLNTKIVGNGYCKRGNGWLYRLQRTLIWSQTCYEEQSLYNCFQLIDKHTEGTGITDAIKNYAKAHYKDIRDSKITRGVPKTGILANCVYMGCKEYGSEFTPKEIGDAFGISSKDVTKGHRRYKKLISEFESNCETNHERKQENYLWRFCGRLGLSASVKRRADSIMNIVNQLVAFSSNDIKSRIAAVIYYLSESYIFGLTKEDISEVSSVSKVTITKLYKKLTDHQNLFYNQKKLSKYLEYKKLNELYKIVYNGNGSTSKDICIDSEIESGKTETINDTVLS